MERERENRKMKMKAMVRVMRKTRTEHDTVMGFVLLGCCDSENV
jgi:hypothetical protein